MRSLLPNVAVGVDQHHYSPDGASRLVYEDPASIKEEEDGEGELDGISRCLDVIDGVVQQLPSTFLAQLIVHVQSIDADTYGDLKDNNMLSASPTQHWLTKAHLL